MESKEFCSNLVGELVHDVVKGVEFNRNAFDEFRGEKKEKKRILSFETIAKRRPDLLLGEDKSEDNVSIFQLKVHQQQKGNPSCGQFALHNSLAIIRALHEQSDLHASEFLTASVRSGACVWEQYRSIENFLLDAAKTKDEISRAKYPWNEESIKAGILERPYSKILMRQYPRIQALRQAGVQISTVPEIGCEILYELNEIFSKEEYCHAFLMGAVDHWNVVVINKQNHLPNIEVIVADSRNKPLLNLNIEQKRKELLREDEEKQAMEIACGGKIETPSYERSFKMKIHLEYLTLMKRNIEAFSRCSARKLDIREFYVDLCVKRILGNFQQHAVENGETSKDLVVRWLKYFCPPRMLLKNHIQQVKVVGSDYLSEVCKRELAEWIVDMRQYERKLEFWRVLDELQRFC